MPFAFDHAASAHTMLLVLVAIIASVSSIILLLVAIVSRRWWRSRYFRRRDARVLMVRRDWEQIVSGQIPPQQWNGDPLTREVVADLLLDLLEGAQAADIGTFVDCLRRSGLLDERIAQARRLKGWKRRAALVTLGRTRAPEALPALTEALVSKDPETVIAAMRGIGRFALPHGADPVLRKLANGTLSVPLPVLKNTLISCCRSRPAILLPYLERTAGESRETLARILGELADTADLPELLVMSADPLPEVRASAARGLARQKPAAALGPLAALAQDDEWFVRLRAVVGLGALRHPAAIPVLVRLLCDRNQKVRQRAAWALLSFEQELPQTLIAVAATGDDYAIQGMVAELDVAGRLPAAICLLRDFRRPGREAALAAIDGALRELGHITAAEPAEVA